MASRVGARASSYCRVAITGALFVAALVWTTGAFAGGPTVSSGPKPAVHCAWAVVVAPSPEAPVADDRPASVPREPSCSYDITTRLPRQSPGPMPQLFVARPADTPRVIELWAAVSYPTGDAFANGEGSVRWDVADANGVAAASVPAAGRSCDGTTAPSSMWSVASAPRGAALSPDAVVNGDRRGLWELCRQGALRVFNGRLTVPPQWSCGVYTVTAVATVGAASTRLAFDVDLVCPPILVLDTKAIAWQVQPGASSTIDGDFDPSTASAPTITNIGERAAQVGIALRPLVSSYTGAAIDSFSISVATRGGVTLGEASLPASDELWLDPAVLRLCPGESMLLSLTVRPPASAPAGEYRGSLSLHSLDAGSC